MYKILGADGRQYGPVNAEQLQRWIAEGRANAYTQVQTEGSSDWKSLGSLPEFAPHFPLAAPPSWTTHRRTTNGYALWGMICGILALFSFCCCCLNVPLGTLGLIFSLIGLSQINERPDVYEGRAVAIIGIVLSALALLVFFLLLTADATSGNFHPPHHHWNFRQP
jgi:Domain of unknown function (DUF4190)/GYF domain 2